MMTYEEARKHPQYSAIPVQTMDSLYDYVDHHGQPGGFLMAVLSNNLFQAVNRADSGNVAALPELVSFIHSHVPTVCYGSPDAVKLWLAKTERSMTLGDIMAVLPAHVTSEIQTMLAGNADSIAFTDRAKAILRPCAAALERIGVLPDYLAYMLLAIRDQLNADGKQPNPAHN